MDTDKKINGNLNVNLYDLNKSIINQMPVMSNEDINDKIDLINKYYSKNRVSHHMLLCHDYHYYTVFEEDSDMPFPEFAGAVLDIIKDLGEVISIDKADDNYSTLEIWIKIPKEKEKEVYAFYLFPYEQGVVFYG